jgi:hypothetical protein
MNPNDYTDGFAVYVATLQRIVVGDTLSPSHSIEKRERFDSCTSTGTASMASTEPT